MRLNAIMFQAAALTIAASPALANSHGSKKRMAHIKVPRGNTTGLVPSLIKGVVDAAGDPIVATVFETAQAPQQSIVYVDAPGSGSGGDSCNSPQVVTVTEVIPANGITYVETIGPSDKTVTHTAPANGPVTRTQTSPDGQATTRVFGPGEVVTQTLMAGATYTRVIPADTTITEVLPAPAAQTLTITVPSPGSPYTFYVEDGSGGPVTQVYQPGSVATLTIPAPAPPTIVTETAGSSPLTITEYILGEDRAVTIPAGQVVTHTQLPASIETVQTAPSGMDLTITEYVFGQLITRSIPAGSTVTRVIPRPMPMATGPSVVTVTEGGSNPQVVTITVQAPPMEMSPAPMGVTVTNTAGSGPVTVTNTMTSPAMPMSTTLPPTPDGECPPVDDTGCGADGAQSSSEAKIITGAFGVITDLSAKLATLVQTLDFFNAPAVFIQVAPAFANIVAEITKDITALGQPGMAPVGCGDADAVVTALADFVEVHQNLLSAVIGKRGLLNSVPGLQFAILPINLVLVTLEGVVDTIAGIVIGFIPTRSCEATKKVDALKMSVTTAISAFS